MCGNSVSVVKIVRNDYIATAFKEEQFSSIAEPSRMFSVIVPTYNRLALLSKTLESLFRQEHPDFEVIVSDDGSTDGTDAYLDKLAADLRIIHVRHANLGPSVSRRLGLDRARGEFVAFTDDDCIVPPDWLSRFSTKFDDTAVAGVGGPTETGNPESLFATANDQINNYFKSALNGRPGLAPYLTSNNVAYRKIALERAGGHDPRFRMGAEDRDLDYRIVQSGGKILFDTANVVLHFNDADLSGFVRHQFHQGRGSHLYYSVARKGASRPPTIPIGAYLGLLGSPFAKFPLVRAFAVSLLIIVAQCAVAAGFAAALFSKGAAKP